MAAMAAFNTGTGAAMAEVSLAVSRRQRRSEQRLLQAVKLKRQRLLMVGKTLRCHYYHSSSCQMHSNPYAGSDDNSDYQNNNEPVGSLFR